MFDLRAGLFLYWCASSRSPLWVNNFTKRIQNSLEQITGTVVSPENRVQVSVPKIGYISQYHQLMKKTYVVCFKDSEWCCTGSLLDFKRFSSSEIHIGWGYQHNLFHTFSVEDISQNSWDLWAVGQGPSSDNSTTKVHNSSYSTLV